MTNIPIENASEPDANAEGTINKPTMQEKRRGSPPSQGEYYLIGSANMDFRNQNRDVSKYPEYYE